MRYMVILMVIIASALAQSACKAPARPVSENQLADAQREYLQFYTDPELLAQAEANARKQGKDQAQPQPPQLAMAPVAPPAPVAPTEKVEPAQPAKTPAPQPQPAPAVAPKPVTAPPAMKKPAVIETPPAPKPQPVEMTKPQPKPIVIKSAVPKKVSAKPKAVAINNQPWLDVLLRQPSAANASAALKDMTQRDVAAQVEALRILCSLRPVGGEQELYITAFTNVSPFVREVAISALLRAYADRSDAWGRRLLETRGGREEDRQHLARIVILNSAVEAYPLAVEAMGSDFSGGALFNARKEILEAGHPIVPSLTRLALRQKRTTSGRIARRLYRWVQNAGSIKEAYYDTFGKEPSEYAVIMFRERYGDSAKPLLQQALQNAGPTMAGYIQQALEDLQNPEAALKTRAKSNASRAYLIVYETRSSKHTILTDTPIWANQIPGDTKEYKTDDNGVIRQKSIGMTVEKLDKLRTLPATALPLVRVDGKSIDRLDMQKR